MLRKGTKQFKPSARPRPPAPRPASSQPSARPSIEHPSQTPAPATRPSDSLPSVIENAVEREASQTALTQESTPHEALSQTSVTTSHEAELSSRTKRKEGPSGVEDSSLSSQPPTKVRKLTPPNEVRGAPTSHERHTAVATAPTHLLSTPPPSSTSQPVARPVPSSDTPTVNQATAQESVRAQTSQVSNPPVVDRSEASRTNTTAVTSNSRIEIPNTASEAGEPSRDAGEARAEKPTELVGTGVSARSLQDGHADSQASGSVTPRSIGNEDTSGLRASEANQPPRAVGPETPISGEAPTPVEETAPPQKKPRKKPAPRKKKVQTQGGDESATTETEPKKPRRAAGPKRERKKKDGEAEKKSKKREETPEGAEDDILDHTTVKMADLCRDIRIGKKFSKHDEIKLRHSRKKVREQIEKDHPELLDLLAGPNDDEAETRNDEPTPIISSNGVQMRVVDGQIVIDERSLQVDRHRQALDEGLVMEEIEENDFTKATNSGAYMKRVSATRWDEAANELFYQGLRQFGTAFEMIAAMFPGRSRRQIKLKFVREERENPQKVDRALMGKTEEIDFDEYTTLTGQKYEEVADIEAEARRIDEEQRAEEAAIESAKAASIQKKKDAISSAARRVLDSVGDEDDEGPESQKENASVAATAKGKKKAAKPKKKNLHSTSGAGGEEIEILGTV
jgi:transcription factor TFIIIB component B''